MPPIPQLPKLTNRGGAGLYGKLSDQVKAVIQSTMPDANGIQQPLVAPYRIAPALQHLAVPISTLIPDPDNARIHPEKNKLAIQQSLRMYGQVKPIVVRKQTNVVMAGNGTLEAAITLGWTEIAASMIEMTDIEAAGYGLADNKTAELARWDFNKVAQIEKMLYNVGHALTGWTDNELIVLRITDFTEWKPPSTPQEMVQQTEKMSRVNDLLIGFSPEQYGNVENALGMMREKSNVSEELSKEQLLELICLEWMEYETR